jgi:hypothetical protein
MTEHAALPESWPEKRKQSDGEGRFEHWMYVHELKAILDRLEPTMWLQPNQVRNLAVYDGDEFIGYIDFFQTSLHSFDQDDDQSDPP